MIPADASLPVLPAAYLPLGVPRWHTLRSGPDRGRQLFYTDEHVGAGGEERTLLLVHGNPANASLFGPTLHTLGQKPIPRTRILTVDHLGFGLSSRATRPMSPIDHADNLDQLLAALDPRRVTLVVHDWGGPIALAALLRRPAVLAQLFILNSGIFPLAPGRSYRNHPFPLLSWATLGRWLPWRLWGRLAAGAIACPAASRRALLHALLRGLCNRRGRAAADPYAEQFAARSNVVASKNLVRLAAHWGEGDERSDPGLAAFYRQLCDGVERCWGPAGTHIEVRLLCGEWDPLGSRKNAGQWLQVLPQLAGGMTFYPDCGHFIPAHRFREIAATLHELLHRP